MRPVRNLFALLVFLTAIAPARAESPRVVIDGQVESSAGSRDATLRVLCNPAADGGAISLELWVPEAAKRKDFDYDDFEGPDAAAGQQPLSRLSAIGPHAFLEISATAGGWYAGDNPDTFVFGINQPSHQPGQIANLLDAIAGNSVKLRWVQDAFDGHTKALRATFSLDAAHAQQLQASVAPCLAAPPAEKRRTK